MLVQQHAEYQRSFQEFLNLIRPFNFTLAQSISSSWLPFHKLSASNEFLWVSEFFICSASFENLKSGSPWNRIESVHFLQVWHLEGSSTWYKVDSKLETYIFPEKNPTMKPPNLRSISKNPPIWLNMSESEYTLLSYSLWTLSSLSLISNNWSVVDYI